MTSFPYHGACEQAVQLAEPLAPREVLVTDAIPCGLSIIQRSSLCLPVTVKGGGLRITRACNTKQAASAIGPSTTPTWIPTGGKPPEHEGNEALQLRVLQITMQTYAYSIAKNDDKNDASKE
jgi:hypothetical protein